MFVSVFKTTAHSNDDKRFVIKALENLGVIFSATLDLQDEDRVLRVETDKPMADRIVALFASENVYCEELGTFLYGRLVEA